VRTARGRGRLARAIDPYGADGVSKKELKENRNFRVSKNGNSQGMLVGMILLISKKILAPDVLLA